MVENVVNGGSIAIASLGGEERTESVLYVEQNLTSEQKSTARANIGALAKGKACYLGDVVGTIK